MSSMIKILLASSLALGASAHMFISSPKPIPGSAAKPPLDASGSNFPCQGAKLPTEGGEIMQAGSQQTLAFDLGGGANTATHGGGSCQLSVTYETDAAKQKDPSNWRVIYSIEGGCPTDAKGNLDGGAGAVVCPENAPDCVNSFNFTIPTGLKDGHVIMAWTWFNTIGNREMYMNCVNAQIKGGDGSEMDVLPAMFVANLASIDSCPTTEQYNVKFPNPGKYVTTRTEGNPYPLAVPTGAGCSAAVLGKSPASSSASASVSSALAASSTKATAASPTKTSEVSPTKASTPPAPSAPAATQATSYGKCSTGQTACSTPGDIICIDSTHFGICDVDNCAISQPVAAGTTCSNGTIMRKRGWKRELMELKMKHGHHHGH